MQIIKTLPYLQKILAEIKSSGKKLAFIPTMGALHYGHISLVKRAKNIPGFSGKILVSIFVNPSQFENAEDLEKYPNTFTQDTEKLKNEGVDYVFYPEISDIYPESSSEILQKSEIELPEIFSRLEGVSRKGHFEGVFQVVHRLFSLIKPDYAIFGQKDFQQVLLIQHLQKKYFSDTNKISIIAAPLFREKSGLAYSSRNMRFSPEEKIRAVVLFQALSSIKQKFLESENFQEFSQKILVSDLQEEGRKILESENLVEKIHYLSFCDAKNFLERGGNEIPQKGDIVLLSVEFSGVHLIDNVIL